MLLASDISVILTLPCHRHHLDEGFFQVTFAVMFNGLRNICITLNVFGDAAGQNAKIVSQL